MKKINVIKLLEEEKEDMQSLKHNTAKEEYMRKVYDFVDEYVVPKLEKLEIDDGIVVFFATQIVNSMGLLDTDESKDISQDFKIFRKVLDKEEIDFLHKDRKIKKQVAEKVCDFILKTINGEISIN